MIMYVWRILLQNCIECIMTQLFVIFAYTLSITKILFCTLYFDFTYSLIYKLIVSLKLNECKQWQCNASSVWDQKIKSGGHITPFNQPCDNVTSLNQNQLTPQNKRHALSVSVDIKLLPKIAETLPLRASVAPALQCYQQCVQLVQNTPDDFQLIS